MFQKNRENNENQPETIIGKSVKVEGDFIGQGDVVVEGVVNGKLITDKSLVVGQEAKIMADVKAESAVIAGEILGNVKVAKQLELKSTSKINGDIETQLISVETGAIINGKCCMIRKNNSAKEVREV